MNRSLRRALLSRRVLLSRRELPSRRALPLRRALCLAATGVLTAAALTVGGSSPAQAAASDCTKRANGFVDISNFLRGNLVGPAYTRNIHANTTLSLRSGPVDDVDGYTTHGWALLENAQDGDRLWMDWTQDGGNSWLQCGPFTSVGTWTSFTTAAKRTSTSSTYMFRACADPTNGNYVCTPWW